MKWNGWPAFSSQRQGQRELHTTRQGRRRLQTPASAATLWVALDRVDEENGCLRYLPTQGASASEQPLRPHDYSGIVGFSQAITDWGADDERREVAVRARPGDLIVHQSLMVHRADAEHRGGRELQCRGL